MLAVSFAQEFGEFAGGLATLAIVLGLVRTVVLEWMLIGKGALILSPRNVRASE